jgi:hypothetical protein
MEKIKYYSVLFIFICQCVQKPSTNIEAFIAETISNMDTTTRDAYSNCPDESALYFFYGSPRDSVSAVLERHPKKQQILQELNDLYLFKCGEYTMDYFWAYALLNHLRGEPYNAKKIHNMYWQEIENSTKLAKQRNRLFDFDSNVRCIKNYIDNHIGDTIHLVFPVKKDDGGNKDAKIDNYLGYYRSFSDYDDSLSIEGILVKKNSDNYQSTYGQVFAGTFWVKIIGKSLSMCTFNGENIEVNDTFGLDINSYNRIIGRSKSSVAGKSNQ